MARSQGEQLVFEVVSKTCAHVSSSSNRGLSSFALRVSLNRQD